MVVWERPEGSWVVAGPPLPEGSRVVRGPPRRSGATRLLTSSG